MKNSVYDTDIRVFRTGDDTRIFAPDGTPIVAPFELLCLWYDEPQFFSRSWHIEKHLIPQRHGTTARILEILEQEYSDHMPDRVLAYQVSTYD